MQCRPPSQTSVSNKRRRKLMRSIRHTLKNHFCILRLLFVYNVDNFHHYQCSFDYTDDYNAIIIGTGKPD